MAAVRPRSLSETASVAIHPTPPYLFQGSFFKPSHFQTQDRAARKHTAWQTVRLDRRSWGVRVSGNESVWHPTVRVCIYGERPITQPQILRFTTVLRRRYDMETDITPFYQLVNRNPRCRPTLLRWMGSRPTCAYSLYELLVVLVCLQNTHVRRTISMMQHLFETYGHLVTFDGQSLWVFWDPRALVGQEGRLRELKLGYRAKSLDKLSQYFANADDGYDDRLRALSDRDLAAALQEIPGVGPATAGGLMFDYFHRYDSLSYLPPWETKIFRRLLREPTTSSTDLVAMAHRTWPDYSMLALHLLFEDQFWRLRQRSSNVLAGLVPT